MLTGMYVRHCRRCGAVDTHSAYGCREIVDPDRPWACRMCPSTAWCLARLTEGAG